MRARGKKGRRGKQVAVGGIRKKKNKHQKDLNEMKTDKLRNSLL
jgi:hypothetical protein